MGEISLRLVITVFVIVNISSCRSGLNLPKSETKPIALSLNDTFYNLCYAKKWSREDVSILQLFNIPVDSAYQLVYLSFIDHKHLRVVAIDSNNISDKQEWVFEGKFKRRGYFKIKLYNYSFFIPFFYQQSIFDKIRLGLTPEENLIIRNDTDHSVYVAINGNAVGPAIGTNATFFFRTVDND